MVTTSKKKQTILVIDDMPDTALIVERRLNDLDVKLLAADSGEAGLAAAAEHMPDLILLDISMPGMSGFDVIRELKNNEKTYPIPVIFLTCADATADKIAGIDLGATDYVTKSFEPGELRARVGAALRAKDLLDMLTTEAEIDGLTGLHNRRYFDRHIERELAACRRYGRDVGLLIIDVDRFKTINDTHGHPKGDQILRRIGAILRATCRETDLPCRYGGDEFTVLMPETSEEQIHVLAERIIRVVGEDKELSVALPDMALTVSIGGGGTGGLGELDQRVPEQLIARADEALYKVKASGRNGYRVGDQFGRGKAISDDAEHATDTDEQTSLPAA